MKVRTLGLALAFAFLTGAIAEAQPGNTINVMVSGLRNNTGTVRCGLFNSAATFPKDGQEFMGALGTPANQQATCTFNNVPPGTYAVAYFHAQQGETKLKTGLFGQPEQGYGFSRDATGTMGPPSFNAASYSYAGGTVNFPATIIYP